MFVCLFVFSSRRRHTRCALLTGVQTCALPICPTAPRMYDEAAQLVQDYGLDACPHHIADRAAFRHAAAEGKTAMEIEPSGKAADEVRQLYKWTCEHVNMQASRKRRANA